MVHSNKVDRETLDEQLRAQDEYLERYYGYREISRYRMKSKEGIVVFFAPRKKRLLQLVVVKSSLAKKFGHIIEKRIKEEQDLGYIPDDGFTPSIVFLKEDNLQYIAGINPP